MSKIYYVYIMASRKHGTLYLGVTNDLVFTTTFDGKLIAFSRSNGAIVWQGTTAELLVDRALVERHLGTG